jgi:tetratricopeptide (TPR) repeat protein
MHVRTNAFEHHAMRSPTATHFVPRILGRLRTYRPSDREIALTLVLAVVIVFAHGLYNDFVQWDDPINLLDNKKFRGLGWPQIEWMFSTTLMGHYIPVTWLTFGLDYVLWGMEPAGYHFTNLVLHAGNVVLFFFLGLWLLPRALPWATVLEVRAAAALAALFFGIHPLRAESVAWATERRDVLSGLMFIACLLCYVTSTVRDGWARRRRLAAALTFFVLALLSKSITMTLPLALLIIDFYPLRRLPLAPAAWLRQPGRRVLLEKIPFFLVGLAGAGISYWAVARHSFFTSTIDYPLSSRILMALYSVCFYIAKTVLPVGLAPLYELPAKVDVFQVQFAAAALAVLLITASLLGLWRHWPAGCAAYVYYAIVIAPVGGLVHAGYQLAHDRYSYLSCLGFALLIGAVPVMLNRAADQGRITRHLVRGATAAILAWIAVLGVLAWDQVRVWRNTESLWLHAVMAEPECSICHNNVAAHLVNKGNLEAAAMHFAQTLALRPDRDKAYAGIGLALIKLDRSSEAEVHLKRALATDGFDVSVLNNMVIALIRQAKFDQAIPYARRVLVLQPENVLFRANYGIALAGAGQLKAALAQFHRAAAIDGYAVEPRIGLVRGYLESGNHGEARKHYTILRQLHPNMAGQFAHHFAF